MMKTAALISLFLISGLLGRSQVYRRAVEVNRELNYQSTEADSNARQIFNALAFSFNQSPRHIRLKASGTFNIELKKALDGRSLLLLSFYRSELNGNTEFAGFVADSILWPSQIQGDIFVYDGRHLRKNIVFKCPTSGGLVEIDVTEFVNSRVGELIFKPDRLDYKYQRNQIQFVTEWIEQVEQYYSFKALLSDIKDRFQRRTSDSQRNTSDILVNHIEMERLSWLLDHEPVIKSLYLHRSDPADVLKMIGQVNRLSKRASTLFDQEMLRDGIPFDTEMESFCRLYVELSTSYLHQAKSLQPSEAGAFINMASIAPAGIESVIIEQIIQHFSAGNTRQYSVIPLCIHKLFTVDAQQLNLDDDFANAFLLLRNATLVQKSYGLPSNQEFNSAFMATFDGVAASYLKVGRMATTQSGYNALSEIYFNKVNELVTQNEDLLLSMPKQDSALPRLLNELLKLGELTNKQCTYSQKMSLLDVNRALILHMEHIHTASYHAFREYCCLGYLNQQLEVLDWLMSVNQYPDASLKLAAIDTFAYKHNDCFPEQDLRLSELSDRLFHIYIDQGDRLLLAGQPGVALEQLVLAEKIGRWLPSGGSELIDQKIDDVAWPLIEDEVRKVRYYIWALRLSEAELLLQFADSIEKRYLGGSNLNAVRLLHDVHQEIEDRVCNMAQQKMDNALNEISAIMRNHAYLSVEKAFESLAQIKLDFPGCSFNENDIQFVTQTAAPVVSYLVQNRQVKKMLFERGYEVAIDKYVNLLKYISDNKLDTLGIQLFSVYTFVGEQRLSLLTIGTVDYYLGKGNDTEALKYLWLAKEQRVKKSDVRNQMRQVAAGLAEKDKKSGVPVDEALENYIGNDQWFSYFKFVYRKNRLL